VPSHKGYQTMTSKALPVGELAEVLARHDIDAATLKLYHGSGDAAVYRLVVRGAQAIDTWRQLRSLVDQTGYWPVVLGDEDSALELAWEYWVYAGDSLPDRPHDTLEGLAATLLNNRAWFFWWD
jgi:Domain of unknown function (DUF4253)